MRSRHSNKILNGHPHSIIGKTLLLALVFCFVLSGTRSFYTAAYPSLIVQKWGGFNSDKSGRVVSVPGDTQVFSLLEQIEYGWPTYASLSDVEQFNYEFFVEYLNESGLATYFTNWDPYNPQYYINIGFAYNSSYEPYYYFYFSKTNQDFNRMNYSVGLDSSTGALDYEFLDRPDYTDFISFDFDMKNVMFMSPYSMTFPSYNRDGNSKYNYINLSSSYGFTSTGLNFYYNLSPLGFDGYNTIIYSDPIFTSNTNYASFNQTCINEFLSSDNDYFLFLSCRTNYSNEFSVTNSTINLGLFETFPVYSSFAIYNLNSDLYTLDYNYPSSDWLYSDVSNLSRYYLYSYCYMNQSELSTPNQVFQVDEDGITPIYKAYPYSLNNQTGYSTPTPIPTASWVSPTPFPTIEVNATLTPIPFIIDGTIDVDQTSLFGTIRGYISILNDYFTGTYFKVFSAASDLIFYFNDWFKFFLIVPIIALTAFVMGRLRRK